MKKITGMLLGTVVAGMLASTAMAVENIKIAFIDPLSGGFAATGEDGLAQFRFATQELVNKMGGVLDGAKFEIVPDGIAYTHINSTMGNKDISRLINLCYRSVGLKETVIFLSSRY